MTDDSDDDDEEEEEEGENDKDGEDEEGNKKKEEGPKSYFLRQHKPRTQLYNAPIEGLMDKFLWELATILLKIFSKQQTDIFFLLFIQKTGFNISCNLSPG